MKKATLRANEIMKDFEDFTYGIRILMLVKRNKDNAKDKGIKVRKIVVNGKEQLRENLEILLELKKQDDTLRIYLSVNERDVTKAIRKFRQNQLDCEYDSEELRNNFYFDIKNKWISALMKPSSRKETKFIIDIDNIMKDDDRVEVLTAAFEECNIKIYKSYATKTGWHIITFPFNYNKLNIQMEDVSIHKDGLLLLDY